MMTTLPAMLPAIAPTAAGEERSSVEACEVSALEVGVDIGTMSELGLVSVICFCGQLRKY